MLFCRQLIQLSLFCCEVSQISSQEPLRELIAGNDASDWGARVRKTMKQTHVRVQDGKGRSVWLGREHTLTHGAQDGGVSIEAEEFRPYDSCDPTQDEKTADSVRSILRLGTTQNREGRTAD